MPNAYVSLEAMKTVARVQSTNKDTDLLRLIEDVSRAIDEYCDQEFYDAIRTLYFDGNAERGIMLDRQNVLSITSLLVDKDGDQTFETTLVEDTDYWLRDYNYYPKREIVLNPRGSQLTVWPHGFRRIKLSGVCGFPGDPRSGLVSDPCTTVGVGGITISATSLPLTSAASASRGQTMLIGTEQMYVSGLSGTTATVVRGVNGTTAAAHLAGATITVRRYDRLIERATFMQVARFWRDSQNGYGTADANAAMGGFNVVSMYPAIRELLNARRVPVLA